MTPEQTTRPKPSRDVHSVILAALTEYAKTCGPVDFTQHHYVRDHMAECVAEKLAEAGFPDQAEVERLRAERNEFCDRVDTLTSVAQGNKRHVRELFAEVQTAQRERDEALARVAELTVYRASHDSIVMGLYTTRDAARAHCEAQFRRELPAAVSGVSADGKRFEGRGAVTDDSSFDWIEDEEDGVAELIAATADGIEVETGYVVTALTVQAAYDEEADE